LFCDQFNKQPRLAELPNTLGPSWRFLSVAGAQSRDLGQIGENALARWRNERYSYESFRLIAAHLRKMEKYFGFAAIAR
jgi:hypothetical protein